MSTKLLAVGNVLMGDDGIAIYLAASLEEELEKLGVEVIYGETDIGYSILQMNDKDRIIILDAVKQGTAVGEVSVYYTRDLDGGLNRVYGHDISFINLLSFYYPNNSYYIITIEVGEVCFHYGLGSRINTILPKIRSEIYRKIEGLLKLS